MRVMDKATNRPINQWIYGGMNKYANKNLNKRRDTPDVTTSTLIIVPLFRISIDVFSPSKIAIFFFRKKLGTDRRRDGPTEGRTDGETNQWTDRISHRDAKSHLKTIYPTQLKIYNSTLINHS